jgi:hypothetical protein
MERRSLPTASATQFSFRVPLWSREARSTVRIFSTARESRNSVMSPSARRKAISLKFYRESPRAKDLWTLPSDRELAGKRIEVQP